MRLLPAALALAAVSTAAPAGAVPISQLVVFGDSNVDIGRLTAELASDTDDGRVPPPNTVAGRSSDGPILPELVAGALGVPQLNFAWGGATAGETNIVGPLLDAPDVLPTGDAEPDRRVRGGARGRPGRCGGALPRLRGLQRPLLRRQGRPGRGRRGRRLRRGEPGGGRDAARGARGGRHRGGHAHPAAGALGRRPPRRGARPRGPQRRRGAPAQRRDPRPRAQPRHGARSRRPAVRRLRHHPQHRRRLLRARGLRALLVRPLAVLHQPCGLLGPHQLRRRAQDVGRPRRARRALRGAVRTDPRGPHPAAGRGLDAARWRRRPARDGAGAGAEARRSSAVQASSPPGRSRHGRGTRSARDGSWARRVAVEIATWRAVSPPLHLLHL